MSAFTTLRRAVQTATPALALGTAALTAVLAACSDSPTAPAGAVASARAPLTSGPAHSTVATTTPTVTSTLTSVSALTWAAPVTQQTASAVIGTAGGKLAFPGGGTLTVPAGAVASNTTFSVTQLAGTIVAYDFQPHGTKFAQPLTVQIATKYTNFYKLTSLAGIQGGYFADATTLNQSTGNAMVNEFMSTSVALDKSSISFTVPHFSGYLVSWNRGGGN